MSVDHSIYSHSLNFNDSFSFSLWAQANINVWNDKTPENTSQMVKVGKLITTEIVTALLIPVAVIETVAQAIISLLAKTVHFFIPKDKSAWFEEHVYLPTISGTVSTFSSIPLGAIRLINNVLKSPKLEKTSEKVAEKIFNLAEKLQPFLKVHIDTLCAHKKSD